MTFYSEAYAIKSIHGPIKSYHNFWWSNLILWLNNVDTLNICMKELFQKIKFLTKWQLWELRQFFPNKAFVCALMVPSWADQLLPQLWWNNLILCLYNVDTLNFCMKEFGSIELFPFVVLNGFSYRGLSLCYYSPYMGWSTPTAAFDGTMWYFA